MAETTDPDAATARPLPPVNAMSEWQQRGWRCVWCANPLGVGLGTALEEEHVIPPGGAAYRWFPRECSDTQACATREARR